MIDIEAKPPQVEITIHPTTDFLKVEGVLCRKWIGKTPTGVSCDVYVRLIRVDTDQPKDAFTGLSPQFEGRLSAGLM